MKRKKIGKGILLGMALALVAGGVIPLNVSAAPFQYLEELEFEKPESCKWGGKAIHWAYAEGITVGKDKEKGEFDPDSPVTRAEAVTMLVKLKGIETSAYNKESAVFSDINNAWYTPFINAAYENGYASGKQEDVFDPNGTLTRAEAATMIVKAMGYELVTDESDATFQDIENGWYTDYIKTAYANKVVSGKTEDCFAPEAEVTRAELVMMLYNSVMNKYEKGEYCAIMISDEHGSFTMTSGGKTILTFDTETDTVTGEGLQIKRGEDWQMVYFDACKSFELLPDNNTLEAMRVFCAGGDLAVMGKNIAKAEVAEDGSMTLYCKAKEDFVLTYFQPYSVPFKIESQEGQVAYTNDDLNVPQKTDPSYEMDVVLGGAVDPPLPISNRIITRNGLYIKHVSSSYYRITPLTDWSSFEIKVDWLG